MRLCIPNRIEDVFKALEHADTVLDHADVHDACRADVRLVLLRKQMNDRGGRTLLLNPQPQVKKVFEIVKAVPVKEVFASVAELDQYLDHIQRTVSGQNL